MVIVLILPFIVGGLFVFLIVRGDVKRPSPRPFGSIIPRVCVVNSDEVLRYQAKTKEEQEEGVRHLRREARGNQVRVYRRFLRQMICNTRLFQQAVIFEQLKVDPSKLSLDYAPRETLIFELVEETWNMRRRLIKRQTRLALSGMSGLGVDQQGFRELLIAYKSLEHDIIALVNMAGETCYRDMLIERLGLTRWKIIPGGSPQAGPA